MYLKTLGINHKSAPIAIREQLAFDTEGAKFITNSLIKSSLVNEIVCISTCNRTELYLETNSTRPILHWLRKYYQLSIKDIKDMTKHAYFLSDQAVVKHLMRVASGLDSMVLGEIQILGQLKNAYQNSIKFGGLGKCLGRLFQTAFAVAKKVHTHTKININPVSVAYIASCLAEQIFSDISKRQVMLIGAGDTIKLLLRHLCAAGVSKILIANRTLERARSLALGISPSCQLEFLTLETLELIVEKLVCSDIIITATSSSAPILSKSLIEKIMTIRQQQPIFLLDLAVPRDIDPEISQLPNVYLYCIDDLQYIALENQRARQCAVQHAEGIINKEAERFMGWMRAQSAIDAICAFRNICIEQKNRSLQEAINKLQNGHDPIAVLQYLAHILNNRLMHQPTILMRKAGFDGNVELLELIKQLYKI